MFCLLAFLNGADFHTSHMEMWFYCKTGLGGLSVPNLYANSARSCRSGGGVEKAGQANNYRKNSMKPGFSEEPEYDSSHSPLHP